MIYKGITLVVLLTILQSGKCEDYLVAMAYQGEDSYITFSAGETGGLMEMQLPHLPFRSVGVLGPFDRRSYLLNDQFKITREVEHAAVIVSGSDEDINVVVNTDGVFSPLPISALGTKYILPSSLAPNRDYRSLLLIATHNMSTTVDIYFRMNRGSVNTLYYEYSDSDVLSLKLNPYQTFRMSTPYDLNGTVINSEHSIAVYSGMEYTSKYMVYDQLLPVKHYGQEYVVAVDDTKLELQIISEDTQVQVTFSSGATVSTGERRLFNRSLERGESLHFTATRPVLVTLSRCDGYSSAFTTVPPVHSYVTRNSVQLYYNSLPVKLKILTDRRANVLTKEEQLNDLLTWRDIAGSKYKVGTLVPPRSFTFISSDFPFTVLSFYNGSVYAIGCNLSSPEPVHYTGQAYLMPLYNRYYNDIPQILASAGETGGQWQVQNPHSGRVWSRRFNPYNTDYFYHKLHEVDTVILVLVFVRDDAIQIKGGMNHRTLFSPLPVPALGTKYIVSSCLPTDNIHLDTTSYISVLVIATHSKKADIDVIFRLDGNVTCDGRTFMDGDILSFRLDNYQTFSLNSSFDITRTIVNATDTIAVYSGTYDVRNRLFSTFDQLLPVKHYGHEYILAIQHYYHYPPFESGMSYQLRVVTDHSDASIMFNNGSSISVGEDGLYRKQCGNPETFYFNTTRPVMATLCVFGGYRHLYALVVVPPVSLYSKLTTLQARETVQILTYQDNSNVDVQQTHDILWTVVSPPVTWKNIPGTRFKVGTLRGGGSTTTIRSNSSFAVLGYALDFIYNGGYSFRTYPDTDTSVPDGLGNRLDTSHRFKGTSTSDGSGIKINTETSTPDGIRIKLNEDDSLQAGSSNNATLVVGVVCGIVIVALLVAFMSYVFYIRRTTIRIKKTTEQVADAPSTPMNIYVLPHRVAGGAAGEDTYTELMFNSPPSGINTDDGTPTYVNISEVNTNAMMNQQC